MNHSFVYGSGELKIIDTENNKRTGKLTDNIDEILAQENLVEVITNELDKKKNSLDVDKETLESRKNWIRKLLMGSAIFIGTTTILGVVATSLITSQPIGVIAFEPLGINPSLAYKLFGDINILEFSALISTLTTIPFASIELLNKMTDNKMLRRSIKRKEREVIGLEKNLEDEQSKLDELNKTKKEIHLEELIIHDVDDKERIAYFEEQYLLLRAYANNYKKYEEYYLQGKLRDKLRNHYEEEQIDVIEEYVKNSDSVQLRLRR